MTVKYVQKNLLYNTRFLTVDSFLSLWANLLWENYYGKLIYGKLISIG